MRRFIETAAAAALASVLASSPSVAQDHGEPGQGRDQVDLEFQGGTALDYIDALRRRAGHLNVIAKSDVGLVRIDDVELRQVDLNSAIHLLDGMVEQSGDRLVQLGVETVRHGPGQPIYIVRAEVVTSRRPGRMHSAVWTVKSILDHGVGAEDLLTAVQTSLDLFSDEDQSTEIRFHTETGLLIARGPVDEIESIQSVIEALDRSPDESPEAMIEQSHRDAVMEIGSLRDRLASSSDEVQQLTRQATEWQTRGELYLARLDQATAEAREAVAERDRVIAELETEIRALRRHVAELEGG